MGKGPQQRLRQAQQGQQYLATAQGHSLMDQIRDPRVTKETNKKTMENPAGGAGCLVQKTQGQPSSQCRCAQWWWHRRDPIRIHTGSAGPARGACGTRGNAVCDGGVLGGEAFPVGN